MLMVRSFIVAPAGNMNSVKNKNWVPDSPRIPRTNEAYKDNEEDREYNTPQQV